jgi:phospholipase C
MKRVAPVLYLWLTVVAVTVLAASSCHSSTPLVPPATTMQNDDRRVSTSLGRYIKHVVIIIQENRSFDNIFNGFPGADTQSWGYASTGAKVDLQRISFEIQGDMYHWLATGVTDYDNGKMDGFNLNGTSVGQTPPQFAYSYLDRAEVAPYWAMARRYVLADHMFPTEFGPSFTAHLELIAGTADLTPSESEADLPSTDPWGCDAASGATTKVINRSRTEFTGPFPCFTQFQTMADTLDAAHVSWKYYAPMVVSGTGSSNWSAFGAIQNVRYGPDWSAKVISPPQQILRDAASGKLARVTWVTPDFNWSDHPDSTDYGPSWVTDIVNAIGTSRAWKSTAIIVLWDDWGGFYDNVPPPQPDFRGLGIRVGCLIISPYVRPHVSHTVYEFGSILKFIEEAFGLPRLGPASAGYTDTRAKSIVDSFDFSRRARRFKPIPAPYPASFFLNEAPSLRAPDDY